MLGIGALKELFYGRLSFSLCLLVLFLTLWSWPLRGGEQEEPWSAAWPDRSTQPVVGGVQGLC